MVGFSGAVMPGPMLAVGIAETPRHGWRTGPIISVGHAIAEVAVVAVLVVGFASIAEKPIVRAVIGIVGGVALILMGGSMAWEAVKKGVKYEAATEKTLGTGRLIGKGITASLSNPFWFVWWATTGLAFVVKSLEYGYIGPVVFYFGHILSDFVWYGFVSILIWNGRSLLAGRGLMILILCCAAFLLYLGGVFVHDGITAV